MYVYIHTYMYVCVCVCVYIYIYIYFTSEVPIYIDNSKIQIEAWIIFKSIIYSQNNVAKWRYLKKVSEEGRSYGRMSRKKNNRKATYYPSTFYKGKVEDEEFEP